MAGHGRSFLMPWWIPSNKSWLLSQTRFCCTEHTGKNNSIHFYMYTTRKKKPFIQNKYMVKSILLEYSHTNNTWYLSLEFTWIYHVLLFWLISSPSVGPFRRSIDSLLVSCLWQHRGRKPAIFYLSRLKLHRGQLGLWIRCHGLIPDDKNEDIDFLNSLGDT